MRIERKLYMVAMVIFAVLLCTTNVHAAKLIMGAGDGGSIATYPAFDTNGELQVNRNETVVFTLTPETNFQVDDFIRGGSAPKNNGSILTMFPDACTVATTAGVMTCTLTDFIDNFTFDASFAAIPVVASFITDQPSGSEAGVVVQFTDTSEFIDSDSNQNTWNWDFGDNSTSTAQDPTHTFAVGTYDVTLTVTNNLTGTSDSYTLVGYEAIEPSITYLTNAGANGSISPVGPHKVPEGTATTFTITPDTQYQVADVLVDGVSIGAVSSVTFDVTDIADHTISASFEPVQTGSVLLEDPSNVYPTLQLAYDAAYIDEGLTEGTFRIQAGTPIEEFLLFDKDILITLLGGYDDTFTNVTSYTIIDGTVTISAGTVTISNLIIGPSST